jgi:nucleotide-binding universal stress UspA family protein
MTILVPFDGSDLSESALVRATALGEAFDESVLAVTIIPQHNAEYARERGWLGPDEECDHQMVVSRIHERVTDIAPSADFQHRTVGRYASAGSIATQLRKTAKDTDATLVAIGSDNAGHMVSSIHSVGSTVAADDMFDVLIVRQTVADDAIPAEPPPTGW